jgi:hypothetical protein
MRKRWAGRRWPKGDHHLIASSILEAELVLDPAQFAGIATWIVPVADRRAEQKLRNNARAQVPGYRQKMHRN